MTSLNWRVDTSCTLTESIVVPGESGPLPSSSGHPSFQLNKQQSDTLGSSSLSFPRQLTRRTLPKSSCPASQTSNCASIYPLTEQTPTMTPALSADLFARVAVSHASSQPHPQARHQSQSQSQHQPNPIGKLYGNPAYYGMDSSEWDIDDLYPPEPTFTTSQGTSSVSNGSSHFTTSPQATRATDPPNKTYAYVLQNTGYQRVRSDKPSRHESWKEMLPGMRRGGDDPRGLDEGIMQMMDRSARERMSEVWGLQEKVRGLVEEVRMWKGKALRAEGEKEREKEREAKNGEKGDNETEHEGKKK
ncbi:hypothetical protein M011DRAFT_527445 [Sporormia fimetaria CBS 119925]|uniref:Uncharacterized protein n=1 Tax=Sporormia fimetaria CBS 119925 TaxID=1340428 RepID=A0A6A6V7B5_9PLEO|nr:hypothetical protein M011DRAFT_527445 [Sporormia fimetaria CBS 119925]